VKIYDLAGNINSNMTSTIIPSDVWLLLGSCAGPTPSISGISSGNDGIIYMALLLRKWVEKHS
jgi:hypothetical protein